MKIIIRHSYFVAFSQKNEEYCSHIKNHRASIVKIIVPEQ